MVSRVPGSTSGPLDRIDRLDPREGAVASVADLLRDGPLSAAVQALGLERQLHHRSQRFGIELALTHYQNEAARKAIDALGK